MDNELMEQRKRRLQVFFEQKIPVHFVTLSDSWFNGYLTYVGNDFCMVLDRVENKPMPIFFNDIKVMDIFEGDYDSLPKTGEMT
jgi:hypothetical protein